MRLVLLLAVAACTGGLANCRSQQPISIGSYAQARRLLPQYERQYSASPNPRGWVGPPPGAAVRLRRHNPTQPALLRGHVELLLENDHVVPQPAALISLGSQSVVADAAGNYVVAVPPGQCQVRAGGVGLLWSMAAPLRVEAGDSIGLNFRLLSDLRPLY